MRLHHLVKGSAVVVFAIGVSAATAQQDKMLRPPQAAEAIIYRDGGYQGPAVNVSRAEPDLGLAFRINSIRVRSGSWQVCEKTNYRGNCRTIDRDSPLLGLRGIQVQSMRPTGGGNGSWPGGEQGSNPNLRGMAAQFFAAPAMRGYRVEACTTGSATADCAKRNAAQFCSSMGWRTSARQAMETVRGRVYLADVLCSNTGT